MMPMSPMRYALHDHDDACIAVTRLIEQMADEGAADRVTLRLQRLCQAAHALAGPVQRRFRSPRVVGSTSASRSGSNVGSLEIVLLRPAPGRRTRSEGSSCANSFRPRPIVLGATPVAIATAAIPP